jgi:hypothetical protein
VHPEQADRITKEFETWMRQLGRLTTMEPAHVAPAA